MINGKRGWIKIVEAFVAVLLITGILLLIISQSNVSENRFDSDIYNKELNILRKVQLNDTLRNSVLGASVPVASIDVEFPLDVSTRIYDDTPSYLECISKICTLENSCTLEGAEIEIKKDIYTRSVSVFSNSTTYSPRQLKLFCWISDLVEYEKNKV